MSNQAQSLYMQLGQLVASTPDFAQRVSLTAEDEKWLAQAYALLAKFVDKTDLEKFKDACRVNVPRSEWAIKAIRTISQRALAMSELDAPDAVRGAFIPAGNPFDAMAAIGSVLRTSTSDVMIVDPYMDEKALTDFGVLAPDQIALRLLADQAHVKPSLKPAVTRWASQHGAARPVSAKTSPPRSLHDRLIIVDGQTVWVLTQSLNAFAARSPASIVRADDEVSSLKVVAYEAIWTSAAPI